MTLSLSLNNQPLLLLYSTLCPYNGVVMSKVQCTMQRRDASLIRAVTSAPLPSSSSPHPALTCPTILPGWRVWKTQSDEGRDCVMNGSFTFPGSSPPVFYYDSSSARSDKADGVAIRHDNSLQTHGIQYFLQFFFSHAG